MTVSSSTDRIVRLCNVSKAYIGPGVRTVAINDVSMEIGAGEFVAIVGSSGSGKSTLLNVMGLIEPADSGQCWIDGAETHTMNEATKAGLRARVFGYVFQGFHLVDTLSVERNVELALRFRAIPREERQRRVQETLERLDIAHRARHFPSQLSGGQQQRVAIARALVASPRAVLADEPTGNLDSSTAREVLSLLIRLNEQGTAIVVVTHAQDVANEAQRRIVMRDGSIEELTNARP